MRCEVRKTCDLFCYVVRRCYLAIPTSNFKRVAPTTAASTRVQSTRTGGAHARVRLDELH